MTCPVLSRGRTLTGKFCVTYPIEQELSPVLGGNGGGTKKKENDFECRELWKTKNVLKVPKEE